MSHITCRLTAKNRDRLRKPTLGNRVWATFTTSTFNIYYLTFLHFFTLLHPAAGVLGGDFFRVWRRNVLGGRQMSVDVIFTRIITDAGWPAPPRYWLTCKCASAAAAAAALYPPPSGIQTFDGQGSRPQLPEMRLGTTDAGTLARLPRHSTGTIGNFRFH